MKINNRAELYNKTVNTLFNAYFKDELEHGKCRACAVGNICLGASKETGIDNEAWGRIFATNPGTIIKNDKIVVRYIQRYTSIQQYTSSLYEEQDAIMRYNEGLTLIEATGYTVEELMKVEYAFESAPKGNGREDYMYNGLVAVLEVLKDIHQVEEDEVSLPRFTNHYKTKQLAF